MKQHVLLTGAEGLIGTLIRQRLADQYDFTYTTLHPVAFPSTVADVADFNAIVPAFEGKDVVVHLAAAVRMDTSWETALRSNLIGTRNIFEAARIAGVNKVVIASTNHVTGMYEAEGFPEIYALSDSRQITPSSPVRPDSFYGLSKAMAEDVGRYYSDLHGIQTIMLRLGWVMANDDPANPPISSDHRLSSYADSLTAAEIGLRAAAIYLSHRDCAELIRCSIEVRNVKFGIYYGCSNNPRQIYDLSTTRRDLGFEPKDSALAVIETTQ